MATIVQTIAGLINLNFTAKDAVTAIGAQLRLDSDGVRLNTSQILPSIGTARTTAAVNGTVSVKTNFKEVITTKSQSALAIGTEVEIDELDSNNDTMYRVHSGSNKRYGIVLTTFVSVGDGLFSGNIGLYIQPN